MSALYRLAVTTVLFFLVIIALIWYGVSRIERHPNSDGISIWHSTDTAVEREGSPESAEICDNVISFMRRARDSLDKRRWRSTLDVTSAGLRIVRGCEPRNLQIQATGLLYSMRALAKRRVGDSTYMFDVGQANRYLLMCVNDPETFGRISGVCEDQLRTNSASQ